MNSNLPFERGATYYDGNENALADSTYALVSEILGQTFSVKNNGQASVVDGATETVGNDATETELMVVRNGSGTDIQGYLGVQYGILPYDADQISSAGDFGHVIDDAYGEGVIKSGDVFYVVVRGPVKVRDGNPGSHSNGAIVGFNSSGEVITSPASGHIIGRVHGDQVVGPGGQVVVNVGHPSAIGPIA